MFKKELTKKVALGSATIAAMTFIVLSTLARSKKSESIYESKDAQKNPMEGKRIIFIEDDSEPQNADGVRGHLQAVGVREVKTRPYHIVKRGLDIILSFGGLVVLSPVYAIVSLAIRIDDPGPVIFTQKRVGKNKQYFKLHKFRSMKMSTPNNVPTHMLENPEQYVTKVGRLIRRYSIDELPQVWDIFLGNMSVVGPRPALWNQDKLISLREELGANDIKPGLTGWSQINGRDELTLEEKAELDGEYVKREGFFTDLRCFFGTVTKVLKKEGVAEGN